MASTKTSNGMINLFKFTLLPTVIILSTTRCNTNITPNIIEDYIISNCNFDDLNESHINLKNVLDVDYDTLFIINGLENTPGIRNITGYKTFNKKKPFYWKWDENVYIFVLKKDGKVVYHDLCDIHSNIMQIVLSSFKEIYGKGFFDGSEVWSYGCFTADSIFLVSQISTEREPHYYYLSCINRDTIKKRYIKRDVIPIYQKRRGEVIDEENWVIIE